MNPTHLCCHGDALQAEKFARFNVARLVGNAILASANDAQQLETVQDAEIHSG